MWMWILKRNRKVDSVYVDSKLITTTKKLMYTELGVARGRGWGGRNG